MDVKVKYLPVPPTAILPTINYSPRLVQRSADQIKYRPEKDLDYKKLIDPEFNYKKTYNEFEQWCDIEWIATNRNDEGSITKFIRQIASVGEKYCNAQLYYLRWASNAAEENIINEYSLIGDLINEIIFQSGARYSKNGELVLPDAIPENPDVKQAKAKAGKPKLTNHQIAMYFYYLEGVEDFQALYPRQWKVKYDWWTKNIEKKVRTIREQIKKKQTWIFKEDLEEVIKALPIDSVNDALKRAITDLSTAPMQKDA